MTAAATAIRVTATIPDIFDLDEIDTVTVTSWASVAQHWISVNLLSVNTAIEGGVIFTAFIIGALLQRFLNPSLGEIIEKTRLPTGIRAFLHQMRRLVRPATVVVLLFAALKIENNFGARYHIHFTFVDAVMRMFWAWIVIRLAVQVVKDTLIQNLIALTVWIIAVLSIFGLLDDTAKLLNDFGLTIGTFHITALIFVKALFTTLLLLYAATAFARMVEHHLERIPAMSTGSRLLISKVVRIVLVMLAIMAGVSLAGINLGIFAVFSGAVGLGIGFGLQKGVSNLFTGMMLLMDRTIQPGDILELPNGTYGVVQQMGTRCTEVVTLDSRSHLIPNEDLVTQPVINWSRGNTNICLSVDFGVDYEHNPHDVIRIATEAAAKPARILKTPAPGCVFKGFGDSSLNFTVAFWIDDPEKGTGGAKSDVLLALWDAFQANGIKIPFPRRDVYMVAPESANSA